MGFTKKDGRRIPQDGDRLFWSSMEVREPDPVEERAGRTCRAAEQARVNTTGRR